jgi:hypothetical protein
LFCGAVPVEDFASKIGSYDGLTHRVEELGLEAGVLSRLYSLVAFPMMGRILQAMRSIARYLVCMWFCGH